MDKVKIIKLVVGGIAFPIVLALVFRLGFGLSFNDTLFSVMSLSFLIGLPFVMGVFSVIFLDDKRAQKNDTNFYYHFFALPYFVH